MFFYLFLATVFIILGTLSSPFHFTLVLLLLAALTCASVYLPSIKNRLHWRNVLIAAMALCYGFVWLQWQLSHRLPIDLDKHEATLKLYVVESKQQQSMQSLLVRVVTNKELVHGVQSAAIQNQAVQIQPLGVRKLRYLKLSLYKPDLAISAGSFIEATVVLRSPRNIANGLAFDYEAWLITKGVDATGYIKELEVLSEGVKPLRKLTIEQLQQRHSQEAWVWIAGLVFGEQDSFNAEQWQLAKQTGTLHLLVVSGLHMGLVLLLLVMVWRVFLRVISVLLRKSVSNLAAWQFLFLLSGSAGYLWLAGSGVALQRAWLMFVIVLVLQNTRLKMSWVTAIAFALLLVVIANPLIWTASGFTYSFSAVFSLLLFFNARKTSFIEAVWLPQWLVFITLLPVFVVWQQPVSLVQGLTNLLAIPYVSFVLLPLSLLNLLFVYDPLAFLLVQAGDLFWWLLQELSLIPLSYVNYLPLLSLLLWPLWLLIFRRGVSYSLALVLSLLIMGSVFLLPAAQKPVAMMIDVGQGQSLVFTTSQHTVVYDAGPFMGQFDTGDAVVSPVLYQLGVKQIDDLIISHNDNDHAGGTGALLNNFSVLQWSGGQQVKGLPETVNLCSHLPQRWQVLSYNFLYRYLSVDKDAWLRLPDNNNNRSCVVQLEWYGTRFLLTGDIAKPVEYDLIRKYNNELKSDVLVLAHHGSSSSSADVFLRTVAPKQIWISSGFNNKFNHPAEDVKQRLHAQNIPWLNTAVVGAIVLHPNGKVIAARDNWQPPWRQPK